jgi:competence protein ComFC
VSVSVIETVGLHWHSLCSWFLDLFFPPRCLGCRQAGAWLCAECVNRAPRVEPPFCACCGDAVDAGDLCARCQVSPLQIQRIFSVFYFEDVIRDAMHWLKYRGRAVVAKPLGDLMAVYWRQRGVPVDVVVPVPLHAARLRERGYNQAALLARAMARRAGLPVDERTLIRQRSTASQVDLDAKQRKENVRAAFRCAGSDLMDKRVLLIDDVCTTGATLEACAIALHEGGAREVYALTLARAR